MIIPSNIDLKLLPYLPLKEKSMFYYEKNLILQPIPCEQIQIYEEWIRKVPEEFRFFLVLLIRCKDLSKEYLTTELGQIQAYFRNIVLREFIKDVHKISILPNHEVKRHWSKKIKTYIKYEVTLLKQTLKVLRMVSDDYGINIYEYLYNIIVENEFLFLTFYRRKNIVLESGIYLSKLENITATKYLRHLQNQNNKLFKILMIDYTNCFDKSEAPYTHDFINMSLDFINRTDEDYLIEYRQLGDTRMNYLSFLIKEHPYLFQPNTKKLEHRGRKNNS